MSLFLTPDMKIGKKNPKTKTAWNVWRGTEAPGKPGNALPASALKNKKQKTSKGTFNQETSIQTKIWLVAYDTSTL